MRLRRGPGLNPLALIAFANNTPAITLERTIYFAPSTWREDFTAPGADFPLLAHETTHIWQYQTRLGEIIGPPSVALDSLFRGPNPYDVAQLAAEVHFGALGYEQQAEAVLEYAVAVLAGDEASHGRYGAILRSGGLCPAG